MALNRRTAGCRITHQPPEMESVCLRAWAGVGAVERGRATLTREQGSLSFLRLPCGTGRPVVWRLLQEESGASGRGGGSQGAREADVTNFSSAPGWPEAAWDFPGWKDSLGNQATWGQGSRTPSPPQPVLSAEEAAEVKGIHSRRGVPSWGPPSLPECPEQVPPIPPASQPQSQIMATKECLGLSVPTNEGFRVQLPQRHLGKISETRVWVSSGHLSPH